jgi:hypothetical protein
MKPKNFLRTENVLQEEEKSRQWQPENIREKEELLKNGNQNREKKMKTILMIINPISSWGKKEREG